LLSKLDLLALTFNILLCSKTPKKPKYNKYKGVVKAQKLKKLKVKPLGKKLSITRKNKIKGREINFIIHIKKLAVGQIPL
jgi:hypothetical protein